MWNRTAVTELLKIDLPILQAGMAGGTAGPELAAAVSHAGGLGTLGAGYMSAGEIRDAIRRIRELTDKPFAVNLFIPEPYEADAKQIEAMEDLLRGYREELGLEKDGRGEGRGEAVRYAEPFEEQMQAVLDESVPAVSFTFGVPPLSWIDALKRSGAILIGTATTVSEGSHLEAEGIDLVVAQGSEAGGHRGTFLGGHEQQLVGTMALVPQLADALHVPIIAAGGIMDGRGIAASLALGASAVQMGSAFVTCRESGAPARHKEALLHSMEESTVISRAFTGKPARAIRNRFIVEMKRHERALPPYPVQHALTRWLRRAAGRQGRVEFMSLWAGQASRLCRDIGAAELVGKLAEEAGRVLDRLR